MMLEDFREFCTLVGVSVIFTVGVVIVFRILTWICERLVAPRIREWRQRRRAIGQLLEDVRRRHHHLIDQ